MIDFRGFLVDLDGVCFVVVLSWFGGMGEGVRA